MVVSPDFLHYMIQSLDHYEKEEKMMQVGGCTLSSPTDIKTDVFLLPVTTTWGWGTWQHFSWESTDLETTKLDEEWRKLFDLSGTLYIHFDA